MNDDIRQFLVLVGGVAVVGGAAWHLGVRQYMLALESDRAAVRQYAGEIELGKIAYQPGETEQALDEIERHADAYRELWAQGSDTSALYERIQNLALRAGVRIENIDPGRGGTSASEGSRLKELGVTASKQGYAIEVRGSFTGIRSFLTAVQRDAGLSRIDSFRIAPAKNATDEDALTATITTSFRAVTGLLEAAEEGDTP